MQYPQLIDRHLLRLARAYSLEVAADRSWVLVKNFRLPPGWEPRTSPVRIGLPKDYPLSPPGLSRQTGVQLPYSLRYRGQRVRNFHEHNNDDGWGWWCYRMLQWNPQRDDLFALLERLSFDLSFPTV